MKLLYKPLGLAFGVVGGLLASAVFRQVWKQVSGDDEAPMATDRDSTWTNVLVAAAIEGAVFGLVRAAAARGGAQTWARVTGVWPDNDNSDNND
jgi:hypothetical protein